MIYTFFFYKVYKGVVKAGNNVGMEVMMTSAFVSIVLIMNLFSLVFLFNGFGVFDFDLNLIKPYSVVIAVFVVLLVFIYYKYFVDVATLIKKLDSKNGFLYSLPPVVIVSIYFIVSIAIMILTSNINI